MKELQQILTPLTPLVEKDTTVPKGEIIKRYKLLKKCNLFIAGLIQALPFSAVGKNEKGLFLL